jgi:hypothetical protein
MTDTADMADPETTLAPPEGHEEHEGGHGHDAAGEALGPVDVTGWLYALGGGLVGLILAAALFVAGGG